MKKLERTILLLVIFVTILVNFVYSDTSSGSISVVVNGGVVNLDTVAVVPLPDEGGGRSKITVPTKEPEIEKPKLGDVGKRDEFKLGRQLAKIINMKIITKYSSLALLIIAIISSILLLLEILYLVFPKLFARKK